MVSLSREKVLEYVNKFRNSPETKKLVAEIEAEREKFVQSILEQVRCAKK